MAPTRLLLHISPFSPSSPPADPPSSHISARLRRQQANGAPAPKPTTPPSLRQNSTLTPKWPTHKPSHKKVLDIDIQGEPETTMAPIGKPGPSETVDATGVEERSPDEATGAIEEHDGCAKTGIIVCEGENLQAYHPLYDPATTSANHCRRSSEFLSEHDRLRRLCIKRMKLKATLRRLQRRKIAQEEKQARKEERDIQAAFAQESQQNEVTRPSPGKVSTESCRAMFSRSDGAAEPMSTMGNLVHKIGYEKVRSVEEAEMTNTTTGASSGAEKAGYHEFFVGRIQGWIRGKFSPAHGSGGKVNKMPIAGENDLLSVDPWYDSDCEDSGIAVPANLEGEDEELAPRATKPRPKAGQGVETKRAKPRRRRGMNPSGTPLQQASPPKPSLPPPLGVGSAPCRVQEDRRVGSAGKAPAWYDSDCEDSGIAVPANLEGEDEELAPRATKPRPKAGQGVETKRAKPRRRRGMNPSGTPLQQAKQAKPRLPPPPGAGSAPCRVPEDWRIGNAGEALDVRLPSGSVVGEYVRLANGWRHWLNEDETKWELTDRLSPAQTAFGQELLRRQHLRMVNVARDMTSSETYARFGFRRDVYDAFAIDAEAPSDRLLQLANTTMTQQEQIWSCLLFQGLHLRPPDHLINSAPRFTRNNVTKHHLITYHHIGSPVSQVGYNQHSVDRMVSYGGSSRRGKTRTGEHDNCERYQWNFDTFCKQNPDIPIPQSESISTIPGLALHYLTFNGDPRQPVSAIPDCNDKTVSTLPHPYCLGSPSYTDPSYTFRSLSASDSPTRTSNAVYLNTGHVLIYEGEKADRLLQFGRESLINIFTHTARGSQDRIRIAAHGTLHLQYNSDDPRFFCFTLAFYDPNVPDVVISNERGGHVGWASSFWEAREIARMVAVFAGLLPSPSWAPPNPGVTVETRECDIWVKEKHPMKEKLEGKAVGGAGRGNGKGGALLLDYEGGTLDSSTLL
ncbi:hypothetical protein JCM11641_006239 [Rhodosporidiobolus odoratus]